ncbi:TonB-dependent receptor [Sphingomicrobium nitratireducens]|uniref:TonB-dependent receptor n=1 Tax=Sphingomicrobium nitratireducens TaxID=2964666 RepID=UPI00223EF90F|nr:TonB-dependent receptor [Sphingomicrobium nitratireducens]
MKITNFATRLLAGSAMAALLSVPAYAQSTEEQKAQVANTPEETNEGVIIVTATKRASTVQDVPFSINAQTEEDIQRANASTMEDLSRDIAGLSIQNLGPGQSQVSVRGVSAGQVIRDQPGVKEQVGVYLDESVISLSLFTPDFDLFDLNRVETLRGPQGTLFGSGSVGGTLRYITNQPRTDRMEGTIEGNINMVEESDVGGHLKAAINVPLSDTLAVRAVGYFQQFAGFIDSVGPFNKENVNDGSRVGGRLSLLFEPSPNVRITPRIVYQELKTNGFNRQEFFNLYSNEFTTPSYTYGEREQYLLVEEGFDDETLLADLTASFQFGGVELTSISSFMDRDIVVSRDASALTGSISVDFGFSDDVVNLPSNLVDTTDLKSFTQEVRLASTGAGPLQWVVGAFHSEVDRDYGQFLPTPGYADVIDAAGAPGDAEAAAGPFDPDSPYNSVVPFDIRQDAIFGEASYEFGKLTATAGLRYFDFKESRSLLFQGFFTGLSVLEQETSSDGFNPRFLLSYEATPNLNINAQVSKGFRLGGVNDPLNEPLCTDDDIAIFKPFAGSYEDESLWNYEAGVKYSRGNVTFNSAAFYTDIKNLQTTIDAGSCSSRIVFNAEKAHTMGVEAEFSVSPADGLDLSLSGSLVEAEFDTSLPGDLPSITGIRDGNRLPSVPKFQMAASAYYQQPLSSRADWFVSASVQHVGSRYTQPADQERNPRDFPHELMFNGMDGTEVTTVDLELPSYELVNLSAGVKLYNGLDVSLYVNNLLDENALMSFDRERGGRARLGYNIGQPRTIGLTVRKQF